MGVNTNGILFYGIAYDEDLAVDALAPNFDGDFETLYAAKMGVHEPNVEYDKTTEPLFQKYWKERRKINEQSGCHVGVYCSGDYPMNFVWVNDGRYIANRGEAIEIPDGLKAKPEWKDQIKTYCEVLNLPYSEPKWFLVSYWG